MMRVILRAALCLALGVWILQADAPAAPAMTAADVEAFLDGVMPLQLQREDIAGAVIAIVKDGKVLFAKGYGFSDVQKRTPVLPDGTLFRPGSISKLFTWTAVMQLVEQGKLDLDRDVNSYIDFKIPETFPMPITLRAILTHTPGFEETAKELFVGDPKDLHPLGDYLKTRLPQRIFPPRTTPAYSNYATALAGYIVQRVSGEAYDDYIENHILKPLAMNHSTFRQPLPELLKGMMSSGYRVASKPARPFEVVQAWPAGSASVTAMDMTHFMLAHLQNGEFGSAHILQPETARLMHSRQFENHPALNGMALGFYEESHNGHRIIGHGGDTVCFHSDLHLMPDANLGFFVSYNSAGKGQISPRSALWEAFLERYLPKTPPPAPAVASAKEDAREVSGRYLVSRRSATNILAVGTVAGELKVVTNSDGTISASAFRGLNGELRKYAEISPMVFREVHGQSLLAFKRDDSGRLVMGIDFPFMVFQKAYWYQNSSFELPMVIAALSVLALVVILWPVGALVRWHYGRQLMLSPQQKRLRLFVRIVCIVQVAFAAAWLSILSGLNDPTKLNDKLDPMIRGIQLLGCLGVIGLVVALYAALRAWTTPKTWWWNKLTDLAVAVAGIAFVWFVFQWHMLHWSLNF